MSQNKQTVANKKAKKFLKKQGDGDDHCGQGTVPHNATQQAVRHLSGVGRIGDVLPGLIVCPNSATGECGKTQFVH
uniref:Uncharacterized protein n=1 Tax=Romanomermis culicivorax TaxID=13658 RepID=A0A915HYX3_ROMCU